MEQLSLFFKIGKFDVEGFAVNSSQGFRLVERSRYVDEVAARVYAASVGPLQRASERQTISICVACGGRVKVGVYKARVYIEIGALAVAMEAGVVKLPLPFPRAYAVRERHNSNYNSKCGEGAHLAAYDK